jgi:alkaline phosphatase
MACAAASCAATQGFPSLRYLHPRIVQVTVIMSVVVLHGCDANTQPQAPGAPPKVVLIIGDGMDDQQITIARNYLVGYNGRLRLDDMPERTAVQVQTVAEDNPTVPVYVADSANSATAMSAGIVTSAGRIATTAQTDQDVTTIMELAIAAGFGTGIVTTSSITDATPASFIAHINERLCEGPRGMVRRNERMPAFSSDCSSDYKARGGRGSIAEQIAASQLDVVLGGGAQQFAQVAEGEATRTVQDLAAANGFHVIGEAAELETLPPEGKVLGLFARGTMPVQWRGADDAKAELVGRLEDGRVQLPEPFVCEPNPDFEGMPTLAAMARTALARLNDGRSFMLMIESASIDKQSHVRRPCGQIGELAQLDETLAVVLDYARAHPETLVLVTADHGQAAKLVPETSVFAALNFASPGYFARVRTPEGAIMGVNYATNDSPTQEDHTGVQVPLFASGLNGRTLPAMIRQADIFGISAEHLGLGKGVKPD